MAVLWHVILFVHQYAKENTMRGISRRNFLKSATALGLGASLFPIMRPLA